MTVPWRATRLGRFSIRIVSGPGVTKPTDRGPPAQAVGAVKVLEMVANGSLPQSS